MDKFIGKRLDGRYEIIDIIGIGGMAMVYKAHDIIEDRIVAIKILKEEYLDNEDFLRRFKNESKAISILDHPNIIKVYDVSFGDRFQYIVMELAQGITLKEYIAQQVVVDWKEAVYFTCQILRALAHAHEHGIIHRDIKPQNIILSENGTIKVTDFGIARFSHSEQKTITDKAIGSVHYISPEQARGKDTDAKSDVYSVGVMLYEMITGTLPFESDSAVSVAIMQLQTKPKKPREINPDIPVGLEQITLKAMEKNTVLRYQSAVDMLKDIEDFKRDPNIVFNHETFVDEQPTKYMDKITLPGEDTEGEKSDDAGEDTAARKPILNILAGIAASLVIVAAVVFSIYMINGMGFADDSTEIETPKLLGLDYNTQVVANSEYAKLNIKVETTAFNEDYPAGQVCDQSPAPGRMIKQNAEIKIKVSAGVQNDPMPNVVNLEQSLAAMQLEHLNLKVLTVTKYSDDIGEGKVIMSYPEEETPVTSGQTVYIVVSKGPMQTMARVPDVRYLAQTEASSILSTCGFSVGEIKVESSNLPKGVVLSQNIERGNMALKGSKVNLTVSGGETTTAGPKKYNLTIPLTQDDTVVNVSVEQDGVSVYETKVRLSDKASIEVALEGKGTSRVKVVFNNDNLNDFVYMTMTVNFDTLTTSDVVRNDLPAGREPTENNTEPETTTVNQAIADSTDPENMQW